MWVNIKFDAEETGNQVMTRWADMVGESGGDSPEKAVEVILDLLTPESNEINGKFLWINNAKLGLNVFFCFSTKFFISRKIIEFQYKRLISNV
ncbi:hypothetical protein ABLO26_01460 [Neobacillus sp. 179-J 1A1 HS]|uniref:hypothetical protein n=1 Tax=Neobacillus driksii TaxID=3035913 RepID=UPI0035BC974A